MGRLLVFPARAVLVLGAVWLILMIPSLIANWPHIPGEVSEEPKTVVVLAHSVSSPAVRINPNCWVPYYDTAVMGVIHLRVDRVLKGVYRGGMLVCLDHLYRLKWAEMGGLYGVRLELVWDDELGLYRVSNHRTSTTWKTVVYCVLPASVGYLLLRLARRLSRKSETRNPRFDNEC